MITDFSTLKKTVQAEAVYNCLRNLTAELQCQLYLVGGCIRDYLMGRTEKIIDMDFASDKALKLARSFARKAGGTFVLLDEEEETGRVIFKRSGKEIIMDFSQMRGKTIEEDIYKRDFTINSIAVSFDDLFNDGGIILTDPTGGKEDIAKKLIRVISCSSLTDDPLRMLRAFRLAANLDFEITPDTASLIALNKEKILFVSAERIEAELFKMLDAANTWKCLKNMYSLGLFEVIIPEMRNLKTDIWEHIFSAYHYLEKIISEEYIEIFPLFTEEITNYINSPYRKAILKFSSFFHHMENTDICQDVCRRLKMSNYKVETITKLVMHHDHINIFLKENKEGIIRKKSILEFFRKTEDDGIGILLLGFADNREKENEHLLIGTVNSVLKLYFHRIKPMWNKTRIVTGEDLMNIFGLTPGPVFKKILEKIEEEQLEGTINSREDAIRFIADFTGEW